MRLKQPMAVDKTERTSFSEEKIFTAKTLTNTQNDRAFKIRDVTTGRLLLLTEKR